MLTRLEPRAEVRATRRASPPLSVRMRAIERQVAQPDRFEIAQPELHLLEHHAADAAARQSARSKRRKNSAASRICMAAISAMLRPPIAGVEGLGPQPRAAAGRAGAVAPPAAEEDADVHLVLPPLQPGEKTVQPAELPLRHAVHDQLPLRLRSTAKTARRPAGRSRRPGPAVLPVRGRRPACSRARSPPRGSTCSDRARPGPCRRR